MKKKCKHEFRFADKSVDSKNKEIIYVFYCIKCLSVIAKKL